MRLKCNPKKKLFCDYVTAYQRPNGQYDKGRGLYVANTMNMKTQKENVRLAYSWGLKRNEFCFLPYCPFCGTSLKDKK